MLLLSFHLFLLMCTAIVNADSLIVIIREINVFMITNKPVWRHVSALDTICCKVSFQSLKIPGMCNKCRCNGCSSKKRFPKKRCRNKKYSLKNPLLIFGGTLFKYLLNDTHMEELVLYWIQYINSLKYKVGCFWRFLYVYTIN